MRIVYSTSGIYSYNPSIGIARKKSQAYVTHKHLEIVHVLWSCRNLLPYHEQFYSKEHSPKYVGLLGDYQITFRTTYPLSLNI
jgi:hypothetical protein